MFPHLAKLRCGSYLFVRTAHTLLTVGVAGSLIFKHTELQDCFTNYKSTQEVLYAVSFYLLATVSLAMYHVTCLADPGFVPVAKKRYADSDEDEESSVGTSMLGENGPMTLRKCGFCGITQPLRARHCEECDHCVRKYDHHCPWLDTCIGENNHRYFLTFLILTACLCTWAFTITWRAIVQKPILEDWFLDNLVFIIDLCVLVPGGFAVWCLSVMHMYLALFNQTTWEIVSRPRITYLNKLEMDANPFHEGYFQNCYRFFVHTGKTRWDTVYKRWYSTENDSASD